MTIKDLAAQTGYSVGTISRVLNNQPHVSELAREIILKAAEESGFQLNENAKQLKQQHSNTILVLVKGRSNHLCLQSKQLLALLALLGLQEHLLELLFLQALLYQKCQTCLYVHHQFHRAR